MSEKFTTEQLVEWLVSGFATLVENPELDAIIARLRAGDALYEAIILDYMVRVSPGVSHYDIMPKKLRKAIAEYEPIPASSQVGDP